MALDAIKEARLSRASFASVFTKRKTTWIALGKQAYEYAKTYTDGPTYDDVAPHLEQALRSNSRFLDVMAKKKQRAKYWYRDFADYVVYKSWNQIKT